MSAWTCRHTDGKVVQKIVPPRPRIPWWKGPGADSEEKQEPASDIDTALVDSLKVLDPKGPIREAAIVVIQEIFGVNHHIRSVCDRLAAEGYVAIAPSIFDRIQPDFQCGYTPDEVANARKFVANP